MNYGYFDEENREYVITKPNTPAPWCNYLGSPEYGAIISNNAGWYSFVALLEIIAPYSGEQFCKEWGKWKDYPLSF